LRSLAVAAASVRTRVRLLARVTNLLTVFEELVIQKTDGRILEDCVLERINEEQCCWIERREERGVDRHHGPQCSEDLEPQRSTIQAT
jgi:hypothetical protein